MTANMKHIQHRIMVKIIGKSEKALGQPLLRLTTTEESGKRTSLGKWRAAGDTKLEKKQKKKKKEKNQGKRTKECSCKEESKKIYIYLKKNSAQAIGGSK